MECGRLDVSPTSELRLMSHPETQISGLRQVKSLLGRSRVLIGERRRILQLLCLNIQTIAGFLFLFLAKQPMPFILLIYLAYFSAKKSKINYTKAHTKVPTHNPGIRDPRALIHPINNQQTTNRQQAAERLLSN